MLSLLEKYNKISWAFVIVIAIVIFYLSSLTFAPGPATTSNVPSTLYHFFAFFFLAFFLLPALVKGKGRGLIFIAILLAILYGISDEFHQLFVPGRVFSFYDLMINSFGILSASLIYSVSLRFRNRKNKSKVERGFTEA